jgi:hypothetical protein
MSMLSLRTTALLTIFVVLAPLGYMHLFSDPVTSLVRDRMGDFVTAIEQEIGLNDPACVYVGPFPLRPDLRNQASGERGCDECKALEAAGFIRFDTGGRSDTYRLQEAARPYYTSQRDPRGRPISTAPVPRLCFGQTVVHEIIEALPPTNLGDVRAVMVKYVPEVREPAPFLFSAEARTLGLPLPVRSKADEGPWLFPPRIHTFRVAFDGTWIEPDPGLSYGKWVSKD